MVDKNKMPLAMGVAFVAFTTQFGGGFASGAQIFQYFINYGIWTLFLPILAQGLLAFFFWFGMRYAYRNKTYDYRSFSDSFYGKYRIVFSNLFEITYLILIATATSAAFATGGSTLNTLTGVPYWICTFVVGAFIFIIAVYGTNLVRKAAATLSVLIIIGLLVVLLPNIAVQWGAIADSISKLASGAVPVGSAESGGFGGALWMCLLYFLFQLPSVGLMYQHTEPLTDEKQVTKAAIYMFVVNTIAMLLAIIGMLAIAFLPELETATIPMLVLVQKGVGASILTPIISILIILGSVSTGVNMIAGIVTRTVNAVERRKPEEERAKGHMLRCVVASLVFTVSVWAISQVGLIAIVKRGYAYLGYAGLISLAIPFVISMIFNNKKQIGKA
ncbi:MAG: YkvI family membrane protein [Lachnospiraceae bacterium]